jgi:uncharacterized protein YutE (UPF0331/DUF86 family)
LKETLDLPETQFVNDRDVYLKAERCLEVIIQAMLDIGNHIISDRQLTRPQHYEDVFEILGQSGVIQTELAERLRGLAGLRNILVHGYITLDRARMRQMVADGFGPFESYANQILEFVDKSDRQV